MAVYTARGDGSGKQPRVPRWQGIAQKARKGRKNAKKLSGDGEAVLLARATDGGKVKLSCEVSAKDHLKFQIAISDMLKLELDALKKRCVRCLSAPRPLTRCALYLPRRCRPQGSEEGEGGQSPQIEHGSWANRHADGRGSVCVKGAGARPVARSASRVRSATDDEKSAARARGARSGGVLCERVIACQGLRHHPYVSPNPFIYVGVLKVT